MSGATSTRRDLWLHAAALGVWWMVFPTVIISLSSASPVEYSAELWATVAAERWGIPPAASMIGIVLGSGLVAAMLAAALEGAANALDRDRRTARDLAWGFRAPGKVGWAAGVIVAVVIVGFEAAYLDARHFMPFFVLAAVLALPFFVSRRGPASGTAEDWRPSFAWPGWRVLGLVIVIGLVDHALDLAPTLLPRVGAMRAGAWVLVFAVSVYLGVLTTGLWVEGCSGGSAPRDVARVAARWPVLRSSLALDCRFGLVWLWIAAPVLFTALVSIWDLPQLAVATGGDVPGLDVLRAVGESAMWVPIAILALPSFLVATRWWIGAVPAGTTDATTR